MSYNRGMTKHHELIAKASEVLATRPTATMDEIAEGVGVSRATLFRRFPSRERLISELCDVAATKYVEAVDRSDPEQDDPESALRRVLTNLAELAPSYGLLAFQPLRAEDEERLLTQVAQADQRLRRLVERGQAKGVFRPDLPAAWITTATAWLVVGAADGLRLGDLARRDVPRLVSETLINGMRTEGGR